MYAELHAHSAFSFLDGASLPEELAGAAAEAGYSAFALTDHNGLSGSMEFAQAAKGLGVKAIHGAEVDLDDGRHLTLLVETQEGWRSLCRILTRAHAHARDHGEPPPAVPLEVLEEHAAGLVCLSGCARHGVHDEPTLRRLLAAFGRENLRVELQRPFQRDDRARNRRLAGLAERLGVAAVATGDVHAHALARAPLQDAFVALRNHSTLDASEPLRRGNTAHVLASPEAMAARFEDHPRAVAEASALADRLRFDLTVDLGYRYPGAEDTTAIRSLAELCWALMAERYPDGNPHVGAAHARLEEELRVIDGLGLAGFFILHRDLLELAREVAVEVRGTDTARALLPPGRGRGSSVSSIVCYLTGLSHIDPVANDLFLGRFLNEELTALPDIDLDFPRDIRAALIPRIHDRYGRERSALVAAFPTFRSRGAIRELGKVLGLPAGELERVARGAEPWAVRGVTADVESALGLEPGGPPAPVIDPDSRGPFAMSTAEWHAMVNGRRPDRDEQRAADETRRAALPGRWAWLARLCDDAYGLPRHLSQHSGGMIVSTRPLIDCCPVLPAAMEGRQLCQWDKDSCADAGFLKIDLLGLGMLSCVERAVELIAHTRGERVDLSRIPYDDAATYSAIQSADTMGVFQIESRAQMQSLYRTRPETLDDLTIQVAIVRPGPILGGAVNPYIARRQRMREDPDFEVPYDHPSLEPVLRDTLGTIIFQDQVIEVAMEFAGFSPGEAEGLRRAMSRKRSAAAIEAFHQRFVEGAARTHGADAETAERVYSMIVGFSGFGFPKAHGAAFGLLAYQSTWLRVHYGPEFLCALLNEQPMGFYAPDTLAHEAQRKGIELIAPDVNLSGEECDRRRRGPHPARAQLRAGRPQHPDQPAHVELLPSAAPATRGSTISPRGDPSAAGHANMCSHPCTPSCTPTPPSPSSTAPRCPRSWRALRPRLGYGAFALTDHNGLSGSMEFAQAAKGLGVKAIHGAEVDLDDGRHLTLLVETQEGWRSLCRILTRAHAHARDHGEPPPAVPLEVLEEHAAGLVCLSGCARHGVHDEPTLRRLLAAFGRENLRVELQRPFQRDDRARNRRLAGLAERLGVAAVATGDVHAHALARAPLQDAFVALRNHTTLDASEPLRRGNTAHVLASPEAMAARFEDHPRAVAEASALADRLRFDLTVDLGYRYPGAEDATAIRSLAELCWALMAERYPDGNPHRRRPRTPGSRRSCA